MDADKLAATLKDIGSDQLKTLPHAMLYQAREKVPLADQGTISPYEHRAFAREVVADNPLMAASLAVAIPAYQAYKSVKGARSPASLDQVLQGFAGIGDGLKAALLPSSTTSQHKGGL